MVNTFVRPAATICLLAVLTVSQATGRSAPTGGQTNSQQITPDATPAYCITEHNVGNIKLAVTNHGVIGAGFSLAGYTDCFTGERVHSCEYPAGSNTLYLFSATYWVGAIVGRDTLVSVGADGWLMANEFHPDEGSQGEIIKRSILDSTGPYFWDAVSEQDFIAVCTDTFTSGVQGLSLDEIDWRPHLPLNIELTQKSYAWSYPYTEDFVLFDCAVKNIGTEPLTDVYIGIYSDADVMEARSNSGFDNDVAGFLGQVPVDNYGCIFNEDINIAWIADNGRDLDEVPDITGTRLLRVPTNLSEISFNWWISNGDYNRDFGPQLKCCIRDLSTGGTGTPAGDRNKYAFLRNGEIDYDQIYTATIQPNDPVWAYPSQFLAYDISDGFDARYLLSFGPFNIAPGQSVPFAYAHVGGENFHVQRDNYQNLWPSRYNPDLYMANVDFADLISNARWAGWVYDNPGVDSDSDGYAGEFQLCGGDTIWTSGDGIPDFNAASAPPSPRLRIEPGQDHMVIRWNGLKTETSKDVFSNRVDFEGYKTYLSSRDGGYVLSGYALVGSYDRTDYITYAWYEASQEWYAIDDPKTSEELRCKYGASCEDKDFHPRKYDKDNPLTLDFPYEMTVAFEPFGSNQADQIRKRYPNQPYPSSLIPELANPDELTAEGYLKYFEYELAIYNLFGEECYQVAVVAYDFGSAMAAVPPQMGNIVENSAEVCLPSVQAVEIDISPGVCPNKLSLFIIHGPLDEDEPPASSRKLNPETETISISILGSDEFDVALIDPATLTFEGRPALSWSIVDNATPANRTFDQCACNPTGADGFIDLNVTFEKPKSVVTPEGVRYGTNWPLMVSGGLSDGTLIFGWDCVTLTRRGDDEPVPSAEANAVLRGSHPNPFNPTTEIRFSLAQTQHVKIELFNVLGQLISVIADQTLEAGEHSVNWDGTGFSSGLYFYRLEAGSIILGGKMMLIK